VALDSISKLSVLITGDDAPLSQAMRRAEQTVRTFSSSIDSSFQKMAGKKLFKAVAGAMAHGMAEGFFAFTEVERRMIKVGERHDELAKKLGIFKGVSVNALDTVAGKWDLLWQNMRDGFTPIASRMGVVFDKLNAMFENKPAIQGMRARRAEVEALEKLADAAEARREAQEKRQKDLAKETADAIEEADNKHRSAFEALQQRGEDLRRSLLTPVEAFREAVHEFNELLRLRMIDSDTFERAVDHARESMNDALRGKKSQSLGPVGAAERFTMQGYSAGLPLRQDDKREEKQLVNINQGMLDVMKHIDAVLQTRPDTQMVRLSNLN
jgi:hypothetical protein